MFQHFVATQDLDDTDRRISRSGYLCSADLDDALAAVFIQPAVLIVKLNSCGSCSRQYTQSTKDLHPHMMYGALMSSLDVLRQSIRDVFPAVVHLGKGITLITRFKKETQPGWTSVM